MDVSNLSAHRLFSKNYYKNLKLPLGEMTFTKDFVKDNRGDPYPVLYQSPDCCESVLHNKYQLQSGTVHRLLGGFFPFASYEITGCTADGSFGFLFRLPQTQASIVYNGSHLLYQDERQEEAVACPDCSSRETMIVSCRPGAFDVFFLKNQVPCHFHTFRSEAFQDSNLQSVFQQSHVAICVSGCTSIEAVSAYLDCGISQADIRPVRYENGQVMMEHGKIYFTLSLRMQEDGYQGIFSWVPGTSDFAFTGALFYDSGDGRWCQDVAASVLYDRNHGQWYLWVCSFCHDHILGYSTFTGDPRFGVNVVDLTLMEPAETGDLHTFQGFHGDEDPDFFYDSTSKKWYLAICRLDPEIGNYRYVFFQSDHPFRGYRYIGQGQPGAETGGSFVQLSNQRVFVCGNAFDKRANYRIYTSNGMYEPHFDFDDGGFRGWGTIVPVELGSRTRYFWLTFDRHNGSDWNWSYGNLYCFEVL